MPAAAVEKKEGKERDLHVGPFMKDILDFSHKNLVFLELEVGPMPNRMFTP
jgi:hypothetical protein